MYSKKQGIPNDQRFANGLYLDSLNKDYWQTFDHWVFPVLFINIPNIQLYIECNLSFNVFCRVAV